MNPVLQSESFERAAYSLRNAIESVDTSRFSDCVDRFERSVNKMAAILGMQAENDQRQHLGHSMAYVESDFINAE